MNIERTKHRGRHVARERAIVLDNGLLEGLARRVAKLVAFLLHRSTFAFGFCAMGCAPVLYVVYRPAGLVAMVMGLGATFGKVGKILDARTGRK